MPKNLTLEETYDKCVSEGKMLPQDKVDINKIKSTIIIAEADESSGNNLKKIISRDSIEWNSVYKLYYDALHELTEAFLRFENIKSDNHQCLFAFLCFKHPELEFSWEFFEKIRTKRNGINYYGNPVNYEDWKEAEIQFGLYINKLKEEINKRIKQ